MSFAAAAQAIKDRLAVNWAVLELHYQNERKDRPIDQEGRPQGFVYIEILGGSGEPISIGAPGANLHRHEGAIFAHVFMPEGQGDAECLTYAESIGLVFQGQDFADIVCGAYEIGGGESGDDEGLYWRRSVHIPFTYDD